MTFPLEIIQTERLIIRPFSNVDANEAFAAITPNITRYMAFEPPTSLAAFEAVWRDWLSSIADGSDYTFVIRHLTGREFVGLVGLHGTSGPEPELGIWLAENEHGRGYGREAVRAVAEWCVARFHPVSFRYPVAEANLSSRRIAEWLGGSVVSNESTAKYASVTYGIPATLQKIQ